MNLIKFFILCLVVIIGFTGCASQKFALDTNRVSVSDLLNYIENSQKKLRGFESTSRITVDSPEFSGTFFAEILYQEPDSLLISATGPFGIHAGTLFIGKERFIFHNQIANRFYNGSVEDYKERNFFQFPLKLSEFMYVFAGKDRLPALKINEYTTRDDNFYIAAETGNIAYRIWIDHNTGHISKIIAETDGQTTYVREYKDFVKLDDIYFPRSISMTRPDQNQAVSVYHTRIILNSDLEKTRFHINISDRAEQIDYSNYNGN